MYTVFKFIFVLCYLFAAALLVPPALADKVSGKASYYGMYFFGKRTANGETFNPYDMTAAHKTLPFDTVVEVTNLINGKKVIVRINDRGPYVDGRVIDLSKAAAESINMIEDGVAPVKIKVIKNG